MGNERLSPDGTLLGEWLLFSLEPGPPLGDLEDYEPLRLSVSEGTEGHVVAEVQAPDSQERKAWVAEFVDENGVYPRFDLVLTRLHKTTILNVALETPDGERVFLFGRYSSEGDFVMFWPILEDVFPKLVPDNAERLHELAKSRMEDDDFYRPIPMVLARAHISAAELYKQGLSAVWDENYGEAIAWLEAAGFFGHPGAQAMASSIYYSYHKDEPWKASDSRKDALRWAALAYQGGYRGKLLDKLLDDAIRSGLLGAESSVVLEAALAFARRRSDDSDGWRIIANTIESELQYRRTGQRSDCDQRVAGAPHELGDFGPTTESTEHFLSAAVSDQRIPLGEYTLNLVIAESGSVVKAYPSKYRYVMRSDESPVVERVPVEGGASATALAELARQHLRFTPEPTTWGLKSCVSVMLPVNITEK